MKQKSIIYLLLLSFTFGISFSSCEDMLDVQSDRHSYETAQDTLYAYWGILKSLQNVGERYVLLGELRGDLVMPGDIVDPNAEVSDSLRRIANFESVTDGDCRYLAARDYYAIINNCNAYIAAADTDRIVYGGTSTNSKYMLREYAQVEAIRAWTYLQLVQLYKEVPFYLDPLTSTDAINDFFNNPNHPTVNAQTLPSMIEGRLLDLIAKEDIGELTYPDYGMYKNMVYSEYCYFPLHLVMGDIYLNGNRYAEAANQYYTYMLKDKVSSILPEKYQVAKARPGFNNIVYNTNSYRCFDVGANEKGRSTNSQYAETITVIPGTTNKLWGNVLRGANEAFGFTAEIKVSTTDMGGDTASVSSRVTLSPKTTKRQFVASHEFSRLCKSYPSLGINDDRDAGFELPEIAYEIVHTSGTPSEDASDARFGWYAHTFAQTTGGNYTQDSCFIDKQNPNGIFSTTYPVIYRQGLVWLRFAEAINRAGYPEYAYAVLRDGLYKGFVPVEGESVVMLIEDEPLVCLRTETTIPGEPDAEDAETPPSETVVVTIELLPKGTDPETYTLGEGQTIEVMPTSIEMTPEKYQTFITDLLNAKGDEVMVLENTNIEYTPEVLRTYISDMAPAMKHTDDVTYTKRGGKSSVAKVVACEYIPVNQYLQAKTVGYLNFSTKNFDPEDKTVRLGIHQRGNGMVAKTCWSDDVYNFDKCVAGKWKAEWPAYEGPLNSYLVSSSEYAEYQQHLIEAVEELIIDELALECCFEGNRYSDLVRFSSRDGRGAKWLEEKINKRGGRPVSVTDANMYLKLPNR